jgi:hypothetical protein
MDPNVKESLVRGAISKILGKDKAEAVPFDPEGSPDARLARERREQLLSGVIPKTGRGSNGGTTPLPQGKAWRPHIGNQQKMRGLRQCWAQLEKLSAKDPWMRETRERLLDAVVDEPMPELAAMNIALGSKLASDEKRAWLVKNPPPFGVSAKSSWADALNHALNSWEELAEKTKAAAVEEGAAL